MKKIALTLLTALTVGVLAGCSGNGAPAESTAAGTEAAETTGSGRGCRGNHSGSRRRGHRGFCGQSV